MRNSYLLVMLVGLAMTGCTPADVNYCRSLGVDELSSEYSPCIQYFHQQEALFGADLSSCSMDADMSYPPTLYDYGHTGFVRSYDPYRGFSYLDRIDIPPDAQHNAQVDALRSRIIQPCMDERGWNSPYSWQAGRHAVTKRPSRSPAPSAPMPADAPLPWLK